MRILIVHNSYQQRGGEDSVVEAEAKMLGEHGHEVEMLQRSNDEIVNMSHIQLAQDTLWSRKASRQVDELISGFKPDVVHTHNVFPLLSPSIYWILKRRGVPVVQTLHNFRLLCPQAMLLRDGLACEDCVGLLPFPGIRHGCYRGSRVQTAVVTAMIGLHRGIGTWQDKVTRYIALNEFCRHKFIEGGLPADRIVVKPNCVEFPSPGIDHNLRVGFLFVGRLSPEKGISVLAGAASKTKANLRVVGTGPEANVLTGLPPTVVRLGALSSEAVMKEMTGARALVMPSISYEGVPRTLVEAFACGLPVIASRIGSLAELINDGVNGLLFNPGDSIDLAEKINWANGNSEAMANMGIAARETFEKHYTPARNYELLMDIYRAAYEEVRGTTSA